MHHWPGEPPVCALKRLLDPDMLNPAWAAWIGFLGYSLAWSSMLSPFWPHLTKGLCRLMLSRSRCFILFVAFIPAHPIEWFLACVAVLYGLGLMIFAAACARVTGRSQIQCARALVPPCIPQSSPDNLSQHIRARSDWVEFEDFTSFSEHKARAFDQNLWIQPTSTTSLHLG